MPLIRTTTERAGFATSSRLIACLVNEHLVRANADSPQTVVIQSLDHEDGDRDYKLFLSLLHPVSIGLVTSLDPTDIVPFHILDINGKEILCPIEIVDHFLKECTADMKEQLASSVRSQEWLFNHLSAEIPSLFSPAIAWEQYIIEGHATHPMHRSRTPFDDLQSVLATPCIKFIAIPRKELNVYGNYEAIMADYLPPSLSSDTLIVPVHELQVSNVLSRVPSATLIPNFERRCIAQASLRSVSPLPASDLPGYHFKLALGIQTTSLLRTLSHYSVYNCPHITPLAKSIAPECLVVLGEPASICSNSTDDDVSEHIACILREDAEVLLPNESIVVAAALVEKTLDDGMPLVRAVFHLDTEQKCIDFLTRYTELACAAFLPPMLKHGFAFEPHGQNTLARFNKHTRELIGFAIRDLGGVLIHREQFEKTTPFQLDILPGSRTATNDIKAVYIVVFHCLIQNQMNRLVRALDLHYSRKGWAIVSNVVKKYIDVDSPAGKIWFKEMIPLKAFLKMKLAHKGRDAVYEETPNVLTLA